LCYIRTHQEEGNVVEDEAKSPSEAAAEELRRVRMRKGWNQQQLADRLYELGAPTDRATISKIETGDRRIALDEVFWFAYALGVSPQALILPRRFGSSVAVTPTTSLETPLALDWLRGYYFASELDDAEEADEFHKIFFISERIEEDAAAWRRYPELSELRDEAAWAVRYAMRGDASSVRDQLDDIQALAKGARRRLDREEQSASPPTRRRTKKPTSRKRKGQR
jgi:transcriptional regulator with XRE-family HTH domain